MEPETPQGPQAPPPPRGEGGGWDNRYQDRWDRRADRWAARAQRREERWQRRQHYWGHGPGGGLWIGFFITFIGIAFLLRNLDIIYFDSIGRYWPVILIALGASKLASARSASESFPGVLLTGVGSIFLLRNLDIIHVNPWQFFWPVMLIFFGVSMLLRHFDGDRPRNIPPPGLSGDSLGADAGTNPGAGPSGRYMGGRSGNGTSDVKRLYADVVFSGTQRKVISQEFEGGKISAVFGGVEIDLREAGTKLDEMVLHCDAVFGGIDVWVPHHWIVDVRGTGVFGAFEDQTMRRATAAANEPRQIPSVPRLIVKGSAVFGGVTIKN